MQFVDIKHSDQIFINNLMTPDSPINCLDIYSHQRWALKNTCFTSGTICIRTGSAEGGHFMQNGLFMRSLHRWMPRRWREEEVSRL